MNYTLERAKVQLELEGQLTTRQLHRLEQAIQEQGWVSQAAQRQQRATGEDEPYYGRSATYGLVLTASVQAVGKSLLRNDLKRFRIQRSASPAKT